MSWLYTQILLVVDVLLICMIWHLKLLKAKLLTIIFFYQIRTTLKILVYATELMIKTLLLGLPQFKLTPTVNCGLWIDKPSDVSF